MRHYRLAGDEHERVAQLLRAGGRSSYAARRRDLVQLMTAGDRAREVAALTLRPPLVTGSLAEAGVHVSAARAAEPWVPASAGTAGQGFMPRGSAKPVGD